jgi:peroxiredoxin
LDLVNITLLADPDLQTIDAWGVRMKGGDISVPATFIVAKDGTIRWTYLGDTQADRPSAEVIVEQVLTLAQ